MKKIYFLFALLASAFVFGQDGNVDLAFNPTPPGSPGFISTIAVDINNNVYIGGYTGLDTGYVKKILPNGSFDPTFNLTFNSYVHRIFVQTDGKILIGGNFTNYSGHSNLIRVDNSGNLDNTFAPNLPNNASFSFIINDIEQQPGTLEILVACLPFEDATFSPFYRFNGTTGANAPFPGTGLSLDVSTAEAQSTSIAPNGNIAIGGEFSHYNSTPRQNIAIINSAGVLQGFNITDVEGYVISLEYQTSTQLLVSSTTNSGSGIFRRYNTNFSGSLDSGFAPVINGMVKDIAVDALGRIIIVGDFTTVNSLNRNGIARLNPDGTVDPCFNPGNGINNGTGINNIHSIEQCALNTLNEVCFYGGFTQYDSESRNNIAKTDSRTIIANPDTATVLASSVQQTAIINVLTNDFYNEVSPVPASSVTLSEVISNPNLTLVLTGTNAGQVNVAANTPPGTYTMRYKICNASTPECICSEADIIVTVNGIIANNDIANIVICNGGSFNVLTYGTPDIVNGVQATTSNVTITLVSTLPFPPGLTFIPATGVVAFTSGMAPCNFTFTYQITSGTLSDTATVTVNKSGTAVAVADSLTLSSGSSGTLNVLANDVYNNCNIQSTSLNTVVSSSASLPAGISLSTTGIVSVASTTLPGTYTFTYLMCSMYANLICASSTVTITVLGTLVANDDYISLCFNGITGSTGGDVTSNDTMNGQPLNDSFVTISIINDGGLPNLSISPTGVITVPANSPFGIYVLNYSICQTSTNNCVSATINLCISNGINSGIGANNTVFAIEVQPNGQILIGGAFTKYNNIPRNRIARLNADLSLDMNFDPNGYGFNNIVHAIALQGNKILVGGIFTGTTNGIQKKYLARLNASDGSIDNTFTNNSFQTYYTTSIPQINVIKLQSDGKVLIGGLFSSINNYPGKVNVARLSDNGVLETGFNSVLNSDTGQVKDLFILPDNGILVGGLNLKLLSNSNIVILYKVTSAGLLDPNFVIGQSLNVASTINAIRRTSGKILIAGNFSSYNNTGPKNIAQISTTGVIDPFTTFNPQLSSNTSILSMDVNLLNNNIIVGGSFNTFNGSTSIGLARLFQNGNYDASFNMGAGFANSSISDTYRIEDIKIQTTDPVNQKILVGGRFLTYNGNQAKYITRLVLPTTPNPSIPIIQGRLMAPGLSDKNVVIYPNPSEGIFNIDLSGYDDVNFDITVHNTLGQVIYRGSISSQNTNQVDLTRFQAGNYFITLQNSYETINKVVTVK